MEETKHSSLKLIIGVGIVCALLVITAAVLELVMKAPSPNAAQQQVVISLTTTSAEALTQLKSAGLINHPFILKIILALEGERSIVPGEYSLSASMNAWQISKVLNQGPSSVWVVIPEGLRKEEIADILAKDLKWTAAEENEWITVDTDKDPEYTEGVYFPDTYLIPLTETPLQVAGRFIDEFNDQFAPYSQEALQKNIKWTTGLTIASIIQREAASSSDMPLISGIIWNRLLSGMRLDIDSTVQYARGNTGSGWWSPITPANEKIDSPYNTYLNDGLPPHPISNPGISAINAAFNPATTTCLYYLHDASRQIHCADTYAEQQQNIQKYLK